MKTSHKVGILKAVFLMSYFIFVIAAVKAWSPTDENRDNQYSVEIVKQEQEDLFHKKN